MIKRQTWQNKVKPFRIHLSKDELNVLLKVLYNEVSYIRHKHRKDPLVYKGQPYYKTALHLIRTYSTPIEFKKNRKVFYHTVGMLDMLLGMMEIHLYNDIKDDFSIGLYNRLCRIYQKKQKEQIDTVAEK